MTSITLMEAPEVADHRGRAEIVYSLLRETFESVSSVDDRDVVTRVLTDLTRALQVNADRLGGRIPSDGHGNPLPDGERERLLWSRVNERADELVAITADLVSMADGLRSASTPTGVE